VNNLAQFEFNGFLISGNRNDKFISLPDIWRAAKGNQSNKPKEWLDTKESKAFIQALTENIYIRNKKANISDLLKTTKGRNGGYWAHWQIALAYAKYLNPELHIAVNNWAMRFLQEERNPELGVNRALKNWEKQGKDEKWRNVRLLGISKRNHFTETLQNHGCTGYDYANCTDAIYKPVLGGSAKAIKQQRAITTNVRDNLSSVELAAIMLAEVIADEKIEQENLQGGRQCESACSIAGYKVQKALV